jgi:CDP-4-dehydro-6-deoxyglucose reductase
MSDVVKFQFDRPELTRPREYVARVVYSEWVAEETLKIAFEPTQEPMFRFEAGQYISILLPKDEARGLRKELRPYSMWNHPDEFEYAVTIAKMVEGGRCTTLLRGLQPGDEVTFVGPLGSFFLRRPLHPHLVFVATGTGLVPMRAMIKDLISTGEIHDRDVTLYFGARSEADLFETAELQRWNDRFPRFRFVPTLSRAGESWTGARGRVTAHLEAAEFPVDDMQMYLCGNGAMIDDVVALMEARGLHRRTRRLVLEKYFD